MYCFLRYLKCEWKLALQQPQTVSLIAAVVIVYTLLFGGLFYNHTVSQVPVAVCNLDQGYNADELLQIFNDSHDITVQYIENDPMQTEKLLDEEKVIGVLVIPQNFSQSLQAQCAATLQFVVNNANTTLASAALNGVQSVVGTYNAQMVVQQRVAEGWSAAQAANVAGSISISPRVLYNSTGSYIDFFLPLLILHSI